MNRRIRLLTCFLAFAMLAALSNNAVALARHKQIQHSKKADAATGVGHKRNSALKKGRHAVHVAAARRKPAPSIDAPAPTAAASPLSGDLAAVKQAIDLVRKSKTGEETIIKNASGDPAAQKLVEWLILRHPDSEASFGRYAAFIANNPSWPSMRLLRQRAEGRLWQERSDAATVHRFTGGHPASGKGRFALARVLLAEGDRNGAERQVREAWRSQELSEHVEAEALDAFREVHRARMDKRIGRQGFFGSDARRAPPRQRRPLDGEGLCRGRGERDQGARAARRGANRSAPGFGLYAVPHSLADASQSVCRRNAADAGSPAHDHGAPGHG